jgi:co-chaperonin GroES (HSP10)
VLLTPARGHRTEIWLGGWVAGMATLAGLVVGAGAGCKEVAAGDTILYSKFGLGSTMLQFQNEEHLLLKEEDVVGVLPAGGDIPDLKPVGDRVLVQVRTTPYSPPRLPSTHPHLAWALWAPESAGVVRRSRGPTREALCEDRWF